MKELICPNCKKNTSISRYKYPCVYCGSNLMLKNYIILKNITKTISVYIAFDLKKRKKVIIKELAIDKLKNWNDESNFKREMRLLLKLKFPLIPKLIESFSKNRKRLYFIRDYVKGVTLEYARVNKHYNIDEVLDIIKDIILILRYLHKNSIIHGNLKPSSFIRKENGRVVLIDLNTINTNADGINEGDFGYSAPEQYKGILIPESDYYALGVIIVTLLSKKLPEEIYEDNIFNWEKHVHVDSDMNMLIKKLLVKSHRKRSSSIKDVIKIIKKIEKSKKNNIKKIDIENYKKLSRKIKNNNGIVFTEKKKARNEKSVISLAKALQWEKLFKILNKTNINDQDRNGDSLLFYAINISDETIIRTLLSKGIDTTLQNKDGNTALMVAIKQKRINISNIILKRTNNMTLKNKENKTILMMAARLGDIELFINIFLKLDYSDEGSLFIAYKYNNYGIVEFILDHGGDVNQKDLIGETILIKSAREGKTKLVKRLIKYNPKLEIKDDESETALFNAIKHENYEIFKLLAENGANINTIDETGRTPLMAAVSFENIEIIRYILFKKADKYIKNKYNDTAIDIARYKNHKMIIKLLS